MASSALSAWNCMVSPFWAASASATACGDNRRRNAPANDETALFRVAALIPENREATKGGGVTQAGRNAS
eukprot:1187194-Prorocentrum_minimum.AAC.1